MNENILQELKHYRERLNYYQRMALANATDKKPLKKGMAPDPVEKWVEIYSVRVKKLERRVSQLGLTLERRKASASTASASAVS